MPVIWLPLHTPMLSRSALQRLVRHRLSMVWATVPGSDAGMQGPDATAGSWQLRTDYRPGDPSILAFAMAPGLLADLQQVAANTGWTWASVVPAFAWAWAALRRPADGWYACVEQDRGLVAKRENATWTAFDPAAPAQPAIADAAQHWQSCARRESHRRGIAYSPAPVAILDPWSGSTGPCKVAAHREGLALAASATP